MQSPITVKKNAPKSLFRDTVGASFTEYILMIGLIVIAGIAAWSAFGNNIDTAIQGQGTTMTGVATGGRR